MRVLITGGAGQLGRDLAAVLGSDAVALSHADLDITNVDMVLAAVGEYGPDAIVNCAAWTDVDGCEGDAVRARLVNADGAGNVARAAGDAFVVQVSTDYVFDGRGSRPYSETDPTNPISEYGRSKLLGEEAVLTSGARAAVVRSAWLYGAGTANFVAAILRASRSRATLSVVDDQVGSPTSTPDLAGALVALIEAGATGVLHGVNAAECSRFEFAQAIFEEAGLDPSRVEPVPTSAMPRPAARPAYAALNGVAWRGAGLPQMRPWREALHEVVPGVLAALDAEAGTR
ncbi:MAG: dTDP-4-dehydrorhamnose reductase [Actinomycetota bacterium]